MARSYSTQPESVVDQAYGYTRRRTDYWDKSDIESLPTRLQPDKCETLDLILRQKVYLLQSRRGYRANTDAHVLAFFASEEYKKAAKPGREGLRVLDLGAGVGLVSILFAKAHNPSELHLVELQGQLANRAMRNLELNDLNGCVTRHDLKDGNLPHCLREQFDIVLINPPFYRMAGGRRAPRLREKHLAHLETSATFSDFLRAASSACDKSNADAFIAVIHDRKEMQRLERAVHENCLTVHASREMLHCPEGEPSRILLHLRPSCHLPSPSSKVKGEFFSDAAELPSDGSSQTFTPSLAPLPLHSSSEACSNSYSEEIEAFLHELPYPALRIGRLRDNC